MTADLPDAVEPQVSPRSDAPRVGLGIGVWGASMLLMLPVFGFFYLYQTRLNAPLLSAAISIIAVGLPTLVACLLPVRLGGLGQIPSYERPDPMVLAGAFFVSLPLYALSAAAVRGAGAWEPVAPAGAPVQVGLGLGALIGMWLAYALLPALAEELMYRGVVMPQISRRWGAAWGIGVTAGLFAFSHLDPAGFLPRLVMGTWFGLLAWRTGSLWASTWAHALNNTWAVSLLAFPGLQVLASWPISVLSLCSFGAAVACFHAAGWLEGPREPASAPAAIRRLTATVPEDLPADASSEAPNAASPPD